MDRKRDGQQQHHSQRAKISAMCDKLVPRSLYGNAWKRGTTQFRLGSYILTTCLVAMIENRAIMFYTFAKGMILSPAAFLWIWLGLIPDILILLILFILLIHAQWKWPQFSGYCTQFGLGLALFFLLILSSNILMLIRSGHNIDWRLIFEVNVASISSLYLSQISNLILILFSQFLLGGILWIIVSLYVHRTINSHRISTLLGRFGIMSIVFGLILTYVLILVLFPPAHSWKDPTSNIGLILFPALFQHYTRTKLPVQLYWEENEVIDVDKLIHAPIVDISRPSTTLKEPIKHVFLIILESIRADVLPLNHHFAKTIRSQFRFNVTANDVTPFLNSLWTQSVRSAATTVASYTLKSLLGTLCGIYPLNEDFLEETNSKNAFYDACLPVLLRETFRTSKNQSIFHSAFFTTARDDFDRQRELFKRMRFDDVYSGFEVLNRTGRIPDLGMFGPADSEILPLLWEWIDNSLMKEKERQLMTSLLMTGTHEPFDMPPNENISAYRTYIKNNRANKYLNTIRVTDTFLKTIIDGLKIRGLYNETLIVIVSDHGYAFYDWGRKFRATWKATLECAFSVPLMFHNPHLEAKQLNGQFTNMDILPTIMDVLLSSLKPANRSTNLLLSVQQNKLKSILSRYEGTSVLRIPAEQQFERYVFYLDNPGNGHVIVKQYPRKLVYDIHNDRVHLYHLAYDPQESVDLISFDHHDFTDTYPDWLQVNRSDNSSRNWRGRWIANKNNLSNDHKALLSKKFDQPTSDSKQNISRVSLKQMLDWADATLQLAATWTALVRVRYFHGNRTVHLWKEDHKSRT